MTPDSLKQARAKEAVRLVVASGNQPSGWLGVPAFVEKVSIETQRLIETDWRPPEPINPDLIEARECCALEAERRERPDHAREYRKGTYDQCDIVQSTLLAIERAKGREVGS